MGQATSIHWDESHPNGKGPWDEINRRWDQRSARTSFPEHERFVHEFKHSNETFVLKPEQMFTEPKPEQNIPLTPLGALFPLAQTNVYRTRTPEHSEHPNKTKKPEHSPERSQTRTPEHSEHRTAFANVRTTFCDNAAPPKRRTFAEAPQTSFLLNTSSY